MLKKLSVFVFCCDEVRADPPDPTWLPLNAETNATQSFLAAAIATAFCAFVLVSASLPIDPPIRTKSTSVSSVSKNRS